MWELIQGERERKKEKERERERERDFLVCYSLKKNIYVRKIYNKYKC